MGKARNGESLRKAKKKTIKEEDIERPTIIEIGRDREMEEKQRREKTNKRRTQQKQGR